MRGIWVFVSSLTGLALGQSFVNPRPAGSGPTGATPFVYTIGSKLTVSWEGTNTTRPVNIVLYQDAVSNNDQEYVEAILTGTTSIDWTVATKRDLSKSSKFFMALFYHGETSPKANTVSFSIAAAANAPDTSTTTTSPSSTTTPASQTPGSTTTTTGSSSPASPASPSATTTSTTGSTSGSTSGSTGGQAEEVTSPSSEMSIGAKAGIGAGVAVFAVLAIALAYLFYRYRKLKQQQQQQQQQQHAELDSSADKAHANVKGYHYQGAPVTPPVAPQPYYEVESRQVAEMDTPGPPAFEMASDPARGYYKAG